MFIHTKRMVYFIRQLFRKLKNHLGISRNVYQPITYFRRMRNQNIVNYT